jgi:hypothetical protein
MKIAPLTALLCALPLAGCYVVQYPGGALTLSPTPNAPQAMRAAPGATDVSAAPVPTPNVASAPMKAAALPPPPPGKTARQTYPNGSPVPPDYRPQATPSSRAPVYPKGSPVPPDDVPPPAPNAVTTNAPPPVPYATDPGYVTYPAYSAYPTYSTYPAYTVYPGYPVYGGYAPYYPSFAPSPWFSNVSFSFSWGRGWGGWGGRCCHRWR